MKKYNRILEELDKDVNIQSIAYKGKVRIIKAKEKSYAIKEKKNAKNKEIFDYLKTRHFSYYPEILKEEEDYEVMQYIEDTEMPEEQKMFDMIDLVSLLHSKTTHYKDVTEDEYKEIYEDIAGNIEYLQSYYNDTITIIESKIFMSPSEYLIANNISKILAAIYYAKQSLNTWYDMVKEKKRIRYVLLHNNLKLEHFLENEKSYLTSWDKAKVGIPIFDFYKLYKSHGLEYDFYELLKQYEKNYPLQKEERLLLFILMSLPELLEETENEYQRCVMTSKKIDLLYKTEFIISPYNTEERKEN